MKWGIRRYQNLDGTLILAGRERYSYKDSNHNAVLNTSVNGCNFSADRTLALEIFGKHNRAFQKFKYDGLFADDYGDYYVFYDNKKKLEAAEYFGSNNTLKTGSKTVFSGNLRNAIKMCPDLQEAYGSYYSKRSSIGLTVDGNGNIESFLIGKSNYYRGI